VSERPLWMQMKGDRFTPDQILTQFGIKEPPVPVHDIARWMGIFVHHVVSPGWDGAIKSTTQRADIWLRMGVATVRERFTLAHEIGHLMLDPLGVEFRDVTLSYPGSNPSETRANRFAAELLMPSWMLHVYNSRLYGESTALARTFEVSLKAMEIRVDTVFR